MTKEEFVADVRDWDERGSFIGKHTCVSLWDKEGNAVTHALFGLPGHIIAMICTYSRSCTHSWKKGPCPQCPSIDHLNFDMPPNYKRRSWKKKRKALYKKIYA